MSFIEFKTTCKMACHEREACKEGYAAMLRTRNYTEMIGVWRDNWLDIVGSKFLDIIKQELQEYYAEDREEFNRGGFYFNESADWGICLVTGTDVEVDVSGSCECWVQGKATVVASGVAKVYNDDVEDATVILKGNSTGHIKMGRVEIRERSTAYVSCDCDCYDGCKVFLSGTAVLTDHGHRRIYAMEQSKVRGSAKRLISLEGKASFELINVSE